jgi:hypothetical protein
VWKKPLKAGLWSGEKRGEICRGIENHEMHGIKGICTGIEP